MVLLVDCRLKSLLRNIHLRYVIAVEKVRILQLNVNLKMPSVTKGKEILFSREWLRKIELDWTEIHRLHDSVDIPIIDRSNPKLKALLNKYNSVFQEGLGTLKDLKAKLIVPDDSTPKIFKARNVPYALKPKVESELERLEQSGVLSKVEFTEWAAPIVPVVKTDGRVRICGDFKVIVNPVLQDITYPLPKIEDNFAKLAGGQYFTKIDLTRAYLQMEVEEDSKKYLTVNTHKGLYRYNRLPFGIKTAPAIWQRTIEQVLQGISGTEVLLDDIVVTDEKKLENSS
ncbi:uncharacterized protein K02A2.6-like [Gigantopelta aegis]|uniref:uncharacterized protein K02A2.6-like n=1 Tax=Gigantopelta aegis TaxID=1735272 RepID=UPI001B88DF67|nr:uncharacterized protein K02A2.6-like [Gigantopelta aegis]